MKQPHFMNKIVGIILLAFFSVTAVQAQEFKFGVKGGLNKTFGGEITGIPSSPGYTGETFYGEGEIGFHGGVWTQLSFGRFFIRPEVVYAKLKSRFDFPQGPSLYEVDELSVPFLVGFNVWGPLDIYAGPAYKKIIDSPMENLEPLADPPHVVVQNFPLSAQLGAKIEFGSFGLDIRYDHSLATAEDQIVDFVSGGPNISNPTMNRATINDSRLHQVIVSLTIKLFDTENAGKRRRKGGSCYF